MKRFLSLVAAGAVGALITVGSLEFLQSDESPQNNVNSAWNHNAGITNTYMAPGGNASAINFTDAAETAMPAVVQIKAAESDQLARQRRQEQRSRDPFSQFFDFDFGFGDDLFANPWGFQPRQGAGSGVIIRDNGYIVTNNHVIDFADDITVKLVDGEEYKAKVIGRDPSTDLAVIKIDEKDLPAIEIGNSDAVKVGEWVLAVGNPFEYLTSTVTAGIVSAIGRDINLIRGEKTIEQFIQTDAAINPGNSGGALVDTKGRLIGINTAIASYTGNYAGYSFAIPANLMVRIVEDIIANGGDIERTSLGVTVEQIDAEYAKELELDLEEGLIVRGLENGGSAEFAGILPNDIIVEVDGKEAVEFDQLKEIIDYSKVGDVLEVKVYRKGDYEIIPVRMRKNL